MQSGPDAFDESRLMTFLTFSVVIMKFQISSRKENRHLSHQD